MGDGGEEIETEVRSASWPVGFLMDDATQRISNAEKDRLEPMS